MRRAPAARRGWRKSSCLPSRLVGELGAAAVGHRPAPDLVTLAALHDARLVDRGDDRRVAREEGLGRAHLRARRQLALGDAVAPVLAELLDGVVLLGAARAERALVHLAAQPEGAGLRELRRPERARVEAVAAADAQVLVVQDDLVL